MCDFFHRSCSNALESLLVTRTIDHSTHRQSHSRSGSTTNNRPRSMHRRGTTKTVNGVAVSEEMGALVGVMLGERVAVSGVAVGGIVACV